MKDREDYRSEFHPFLLLFLGAALMEAVHVSSLPGPVVQLFRV